MHIDEFLRRCSDAGEVEINVQGGYFFSYLTGYVKGNDFYLLMVTAMKIAEKNNYKPLTDWEMMEPHVKFWEAAAVMEHWKGTLEADRTLKNLLGGKNGTSKQ